MRKILVINSNSNSDTTRGLMKKLEPSFWKRHRDHVY